jgi:cysteine desulfurase
MKKFLALSFLMIPALASENEPLYLDYAASYALSEEALDEFIRVARMDGNSSGLNVHAKRLKKIEEQAAKIVAEKINAKPDQIHFCSGATMANNIAILGVAYMNPGCHLITSKIEHKSVLNVFKHLETRGYKVTYLNVDRHGNIDLDQLRRSITKDTKLISIQMLNSEIGTLQDVKTIGEIARQHKILSHTDAAQAFCKYDIDVEALHIDLLTIAGHKIGAPKGVGTLYIRDPSRLQPILFGSGDEFSPGSKPTELIAALAVAVQKFRFNREKITAIFNALTTELSKIENIHINSSSPSHIVSVSIAGVLLTDIMDRLKEYSFAAGCSCTGQERSNVLEAIDPEDQLPTCTLRISFSDTIDPRQFVIFAQHLKTVVDQLRQEKNVDKGCESVDNVKKKDLGDSLNKIQELLERGKKHG